MKTLADGNTVSSRSFYYLLDWNDKDDKEFMAQQFGKTQLSSLTIVEYIRLFRYATKMELSKMAI